jgi:hypothetical protein
MRWKSRAIRVGGKKGKARVKGVDLGLIIVVTRLGDRVPGAVSDTAYSSTM